MASRISSKRYSPEGVTAPSIGATREEGHRWTYTSRSSLSCGAEDPADHAGQLPNDSDRNDNQHQSYHKTGPRMGTYQPNEQKSSTVLGQAQNPIAERLWTEI